MNSSLYQKLNKFPLDDRLSGLKFSDRLIRENGWSESYTQKVISEYKRFLYLSKEAGHPVTPSDAVDQAWHLHLCYTENYWTELCQNTLKMPLHHGPTKGGLKEQSKFLHLYQKTLDSYKIHFNEPAPEEIWPSASQRFKPQSFQRVDTTKNLILNKKTVQLSSLGILGTLLLASCATVATSDGLEEIYIILGALFCTFIVVAALATVARSGKNNSSGSQTSNSNTTSSFFDSDDSSSSEDSSSNDGGGCSSGCGGGCGGGD